MFQNIASAKYNAHVVGKVGVSTNARDEANILEWIAFHLVVGFDHIVVVDHLSERPIAQLLKPCFADRITVIRFSERTQNGSKKHMVENICVPEMKRLGVEWMIHLDADEYFNPCLPGRKVQDFLSAFGPEVHQIRLNWMLFGSSFHNDQPEGLVLENFTLCAGVADPHVKCFFRVSSFQALWNPHVVLLKHAESDTVKTVNVFNQQCNDHLCCFEDTTKHHFSTFPCLINHYYVQSYKTYRNRKTRYPRDDCGFFRPVATAMTVHHGTFVDLAQDKGSDVQWFKTNFQRFPEKTNVYLWEFLKVHFSQNTRDMMARIRSV